MSSVKKWMVCAAAGAATCGSVVAFAQDKPSVIVDGKSQEVISTVSGITGIVYQPTSSSYQLAVAADGYLFCDNIGPVGSMKLSLSHAEEAPSGSSLANVQWAQPVVSINGFTYRGGNLVINPSSAVTSLTCLSLAKNGSVASGLREGVFDNGYDGQNAENFPHLLNWVPPAGVPGWHDSQWEPEGANWAEVPADACGWDAYQSARVQEHEGCATITGVRGAANGARRAPTMWTNMRLAGGVAYFTYVFRVDARYGAPTEPLPTKMELPPVSVNGGDVPSAAIMQVLVRDSYNASFLSKQGTVCSFTEFPDNPTTSGDFCASVSAQSTPLAADGFVNLPLWLGPSTPYQPYASFYVAVTRSLSSIPPVGFNSPLAAASIFVDPAIAPEGYDAFLGDNAAFAFSSLEKGFAWMVTY